MNEQEIDKRFEAIEKRLATLEQGKVSDRPQGEKVKSIKEFLLEKNPVKDFQKTLTISYYLENYKNMNSLNAKDIENGYREAKEAVPDNVNYKVIQNIKSGYMMEAEEKKDKLKAWVLTNTGEKLVEHGFDKDDESE